MTVASFHLVRYPWRQAHRGLVAMATDRRALPGVPGLELWRVLGTSRGSTTSLSADLRRWALFALWEDDAALDRFLAEHPVPARWASRAEEAYGVRLRPLGGHGSWNGVDVLAGATGERCDGPVAVLTRAVVRVPRLVTFARAGRPVSDALQGAPGLLAAAGVGEAPIGRQATFSLWRSEASMQEWAYDAAGPGRAHVDVVRRTRAEGWYGEELFARFAPYASTGTWGGHDPLAPEG